MAASAVLATGLAGCAGSRQAPAAPSGPDPVVASFDGTTLTLREFETAYAASVSSWEEAADDGMAEYQDFLERYVNYRLKVRQARALGLDRDPELRAEMDSYRDQLARPYFLDQRVLDDIVRDLYEKQAEELNAAHLLIRVDPDAAPADTLAAYQKALALRDSVVTHGVEFDDLAFRQSEDPSARRNRGDLGWFTGGRMVHEFEEAAYALPLGEVSPPVRSQFGYHLIQVNERRPATPDIRAAHILVRINGATAADTAAARETIEQLRERVVAGEDFATLARQYSDDVASGRNGGDLGTFGFGRMVEPFNSVAFALREPGELSDIVETRFGFHLIRLTERQQRPTFQEAYADLKQLAQQLPRASERQTELARGFRAEYGATFDEALVRQALGQFDADSVLYQLRRDGFGTYDAQTFATMGDETYTFADYYSLFQRSPVRPERDQVAQVIRLMDGFVNQKALDRAINSLQETDPAFGELIQQYADGVLLFRISEDSVWTPASQDEAGLRAYYEANAGDFRWPRRHRVLAFTTPSDSMLNAVAAHFDAGMPVGEIMARNSDARFALRLDTLHLADTTGTAIDMALRLQPGQRTEILPERSRMAIYVLDAIEDPRAKTFDEARAEVVTAYQNTIEAAWVRRLRAQYQARTFPERLEGAFSGPPPADAFPERETAASAQ